MELPENESISEPLQDEAERPVDVVVELSLDEGIAATLAPVSESETNAGEDEQEGQEEEQAAQAAQAAQAEGKSATDPALGADPITEEKRTELLAAAAAQMPAQFDKPKRGLDLQHPLVQELMFNPQSWRIWPTVAVLRWVLRQAPIGMRRLIYRSLPSLKFTTSEIEDVAIQTAGIGGVEVTLGAPGLAADGSPLPTTDIARIIADRQQGGGLGLWLDMPGDRFMHLAERSLARHSAAFALATGGDIRAVSTAADLVGRSAPLAARANGVLMDAWNREPVGAIGLAAMFMGAPSAVGLAGVVGAFTRLKVTIEEFSGAEVSVLRPTFVGGRFGSMLGRRCTLPSAGVSIVVCGGADPQAREWAQQARRRASLYRLAHAYIGSHVPTAHIFLTLDANNAPSAMLGRSALGGLAVLGEATRSVRLPLANGP